VVSRIHKTLKLTCRRTNLTKSFSNIIEPVTGNVEIENQVNITVVFPDATLPNPTDGGFKNQEAFRKFVMEHQNPKTPKPQNP
jgi:hypothetical protein